MKKFLVGMLLAVTTLACSNLFGQSQATAVNASNVVPTQVKFSGTLTAFNGQPLSGTVGVTFLLYANEQGGAPLWMETQNITPDKNGHYTVVLGSTTSQGLPTDLFASGEARWLGVQAQGEAEQPRVLLLSVPYALKAGDAQTVGGLPASAFVLAAPPNAATAPAATNPVSATAPAVTPLASSDVTTTGGTANTIPMFTTAANIQNSILTQTGTTAINVAGKLNLPATGTATTSAGKNSQPQDYVASSYNSSTKAAVAQTFQLQAEPAGNDTSTAAGTLNLLYGSGTATPAETGLKISSKGLFTFATGQTFPGTGTITGVTAGADLTGGGTSGKVTLSLNTAKVPLLASANTFTDGQTINATGSVDGLDANAVSGNGVTAISTSGIGLSAASTNSNGVLGGTGNSQAYGVYGLNFGGGVGVYGGGGTGMYGFSNATLGIGTQGSWLKASTVGAETGQTGVWGDSSAGTGVTGTSDSNIGVYGQSANFNGVSGFSNSASGAGVSGNNTNGGYGVYGATTAGGTAGYFQGNLQTTGLITTYNGLPTYGNGVPSVVAYTAFASDGSANTTPQTLFTPANDAVLRVTLLQECLGTSTGGGIFTTYFEWTLPTGASGFLAVQDGTCSSLNQNQWGTVIAHVKGGTPLQFYYSGMFSPFQTTILVEQLL